MSVFTCCGLHRRLGDVAFVDERRCSECDEIAPEEQAAALEVLARMSGASSRKTPLSRKKSSDSAQVETTIAAARFWIEAYLSKSWIFSGSRRELEAAMALLDSAEHELRASRLAKAHVGGRRGAVFCHSDPLIGLMEGELTVGPAADSMAWLLQTFTAADIEAAAGNQAAEGHHATASSSSSNHRVKRRAVWKRLHSFEEVDRVMAEAVQDPEAGVLLERAGCLDFDALAFTLLPMPGRPLQVLGAYCLDRSDVVGSLCEQGQVEERVKFHMCLIRFLGYIEELYKNVPYHGVAHAADVMMTMEWFLKTGYLSRKVSSLDHLMVLVASAIHDVGHPGRNNLFLSKTMAPQAVTYNDKSVLENMHLALSFETMQRNADCNWFTMLPRAFQREDDEPGAPAVNVQHYARRGLIDMVLATDMAKHAEHVRHLHDFLKARAAAQEASSSPTSGAGVQAKRQEALERKLFLLTQTLHAADISNPCKPKQMMLRWTTRVLDEFWAQGDEERALGMDISPLCDRESGRQAVAKGQIGFISFVVQPLYTPIAQLIPEVKDATKVLAQNRSFWEDMEREQVPFEDIFAQADR